MIPRQIIIDLVEGDTSPPLRVRFSGLNLTQYSRIDFHMRRPNGSRITRSAVVDALDLELCSVSWQAGDLVRGRTLAEFEFFPLTGGRFTLPQGLPIYLDVRGDLK